jgi:hypothetical protein
MGVDSLLEIMAGMISYFIGLACGILIGRLWFNPDRRR